MLYGISPGPQEGSRCIKRCECIYLGLFVDCFNFCRAYWHGSVTVHTRRASTEQEYQDFVSEVQTLCRIRHEKIQLFMGVCFDLKPERLAIVVE